MLESLKIRSYGAKGRGSGVPLQETMEVGGAGDGGVDQQEATSAICLSRLERKACLSWYQRALPYSPRTLLHSRYFLGNVCDAPKLTD